MRRLFVGLVVAAATVLAPIGALAGNQEVAETIAASLRESGQLHGFKIGVKYQDGTAWLRGEVANQEQMNTALKLVFQTPGVTRVVNNLTVVDQAAAPATTPAVQPESALTKVQTALTQRLGKLQQSTGAVAPEQFARVSSDSSPDQTRNSAQRIQAAATTPLPPTAQAVRVPTEFAQSSVQPVAAMTAKEPTLAPALPLNKVPLTGPRTGTPIPVAYAQPPVTEEVVQGVPTPAAPMTPAPATAAPIAGVPTEAVPIQGMPVQGMQVQGAPMPMYGAPVPTAAMPPASYDQPHLPAYAWPGYAAYPNYAGVTYPKQYSPTAWPYIGPFYPYPQVPLGWRKVCLEWHDGWWFLDFDDGASHDWFSGLWRHKH
ncbi:MAG: BON domain-containing protein [Pirellulales bacterium]|nr:BON domain-containing protein [Pirellulales bacterium]